MAFDEKNLEPITGGPTKPKLDLAAVREKLAGKSGRGYWRSLEEVADTAEFQDWVEDEFPNRKSLLQLNRRDLLKFMGASMALAGLSGCRSVFLGQSKVIPYVKQPEELVLGVPLFYASTIPLAGFAQGVLVEQHEGRPTKLEGNPEHPSSLGAIDAITQAAVLSLYDPERAANVMDSGDISTWELFDVALKEIMKGAKGIRLLTGAVTSPVLLDQIQTFLQKNPGAKWHAYEPVSRANIYGGSQIAFGKPMETLYDFSKADVVLTLDGDFLATEQTPGAVRYARDFASLRRVAGKQGTMNRLYAVESTPSLSGMLADHRWALRSSEIPSFAQALASALGVAGASGGSFAPLSADHFQAMVDDLRGANGRAVVFPGLHQSAEVHALVHAINEALSAPGNTVSHIPAVDGSPNALGLKELVSDMDSGAADTVFILGGNPVYDAPADYKFADALRKVPNVIYLAQETTETTEYAKWTLPQTHALEEWGDALAHDGTPSMVQPLIAPLFDGRCALQVMAALNGKPQASYDIVKNFWKKKIGGTGDFEATWRDFVHDGVLPSQTPTPTVARVQSANMATMSFDPPVSGIELNFRPDPKIYDGRFANNGWLQELPSPISKITWDNAAIMSLKMAEELGVTNDSVIALNANGQTVEAGVYIQPGMAQNAITVHLGYGRTRGGSVATATGRDGGGFNAYALRTSNQMAATSVTAKATGKTMDLASTQGHNPLGGDRIGDERDILREATLQQFNRDYTELVPYSAFPQDEIKKNNMYVEEVFEWNGAQWGMTIDLNVCTGCNACVTACQAENNIPVVGKVQVNVNREMHWIRIDRYYKGDEANPQLTWQPIMCVHCEKAPCEPVCPVAATVHSHEGLNQMVYNRCVGTRYCSNNCPYKVRRFNYLNYTDNQPNFADKVFEDENIKGPIHSAKQNGIALLKMINNPSVTVRSRGVMEKCSYCVQRINAARIEGKKQGTDPKDGDIVTACQQACPTQAIVFGNIADKESKVAKLRNDPRAWLLLEELQTRPRTSHLAKLRNPNPAITPIPEPDKRKKDHHHGEEGHGEDHASRENVLDNNDRNTQVVLNG